MTHAPRRGLGSAGRRSRPPAPRRAAGLRLRRRHDGQRALARPVPPGPRLARHRGLPHRRPALGLPRRDAGPAGAAGRPRPALHRRDGAHLAVLPLAGDDPDRAVRPRHRRVGQPPPAGRLAAGGAAGPRGRHDRDRARRARLRDRAARQVLQRLLQRERPSTTSRRAGTTSSPSGRPGTAAATWTSGCRGPRTSTGRAPTRRTSWRSTPTRSSRPPPRRPRCSCTSRRSRRTRRSPRPGGTPPARGSARRCRAWWRCVTAAASPGGCASRSRSPPRRWSRSTTARTGHCGRWTTRSAEVLRSLRRTHRLHNTLFIFMSDNGLMRGEHGITGKHVPYDAATRIPMVVRWDGHVAPGTRDTRLALNVDVAATVTSAAGVTMATDGLDLLGTGASRRLPDGGDRQARHRPARPTAAGAPSATSSCTTPTARRSSTTTGSTRESGSTGPATRRTGTSCATCAPRPAGLRPGAARLQLAGRRGPLDHRRAAGPGQPPDRPPRDRAPLARARPETLTEAGEPDPQRRTDRNRSSVRRTS